MKIFSRQISDLVETVRDIIGSTLVQGSNVTIVVDDPGDTVTISSSGSGGGSVSSSPAILATATWAPAGFTNAPASAVGATTPNVIDASLTVSFVGPASGKVRVAFTARLETKQLSDYHWLLWDNVANAEVANSRHWVARTVLIDRRTSFIYLTVTPGITYNWTWRQYQDVGTGAVVSAWSTQPASMEVMDKDGGAPSWIVNTTDQRNTPTAPTAFDDEFLTDDAKWTKVNNPAAPNAMSVSAFPGLLWVGLPEQTGTDNFDALVRRYQAPPAGTTAWEFVTRVALTMATDGWQTEGGEFAGVWLYLADNVNKDAIGVGIQFNIGALATPILTNLLNVSAGVIAGGAQAINVQMPGEMIWVKLKKSSTSAYTVAQNYDLYISGDGLIWHHIAQQSKTFVNACNEIGVCFRAPKPGQVGSPVAHVLVDSFRKAS